MVSNKKILQKKKKAITHKQNEKTNHRMGENIVNKATHKELLSKIYQYKQLM